LPEISLMTSRCRCVDDDHDGDRALTNGVHSNVEGLW
jgi:hypothetical protein